MNPTIKNYQNILAQIRRAEKSHHRPTNSVECLAVTKRFPVETFQPLIAAGHKHFAENTVKAALPKITALSDQNLVWHYIGRIQTNKCQEIAENFSWVHTLCRDKEALALAKYRSSQLPPLQVCIQIKLDDNPARNGIAPQDILALAQTIESFATIQLRGLMVIPDPNLSALEQQAVFKKTVALGQTLNQQGHHIDTYSMGMTNDFELAIQEGSTMVRIGTGLFGSRESHHEK